MKVGKSIALALVLLILTASNIWAEIGYTVKDKDTLPKIAAKFHVSLDDLYSANDFDNTSVIQPGQRIIIPYTTEEEPVNQPVEYRVKKGDCLAKIGRKFGCSINDLRKLNNLKQNSVLRIDQVILIPNVEADINQKENLESPDENQLNSSGEVKVDVLAEEILGKNLLDLSQLNDAGINESNPDNPSDESGKSVKIKTDNTESQKITVIKKKINIPEKLEENGKKEATSGYIKHKVARGDAVYKLARHYGVDASEIFKANNISKRTILRIGQMLLIPDPAGSLKTRSDNKTDDGLISRNLALRDQLVRHALKYQGLKYIYGGNSLTRGVDCSGFTMRIYEKYGVKLDHSSRSQARKGKKVDRNNLLPGDLVFFRTTGKNVSHVGIYIGNGKMIHASQSSRQIQIDSINSAYFKRNFVTARRFL